MVTNNQLIDYLQQFPSSSIIVLNEDDANRCGEKDEFVNLQWALEQLESK